MNAISSHAAELARAPTVAGRDPRPAIDHLGVQRAVRELLLALDADVDSAGLKDTPRRVADAYVELLTPRPFRSEEHTSELQSQFHLVCRLLLEKKKKQITHISQQKKKKKQAKKKKNKHKN